MDQSHASGNVTWAVDEELGGRYDSQLLDNSGELSANQSADACLLQGNTSGRGSANDRTAIECHKQHGMWCRVKAFSLPRSGRERGVVHEEQEGGVSKLTRLKRLRKGYVRSDGRAFQFIKAERDLRKHASHMELQIQSLNEINDGLQEDARIREATMDELQRKLRSTERQLIASQRRSAKLNGILELAKLQGDAQQQVLDVKQDDVIKMAVKQAELYDQIRKLKLTIETLRNKLEKCEAERSGSEYQPQDETAEHPSSMPLPSSTTRTMNRMQAAVNARRAASRHVQLTDRVPDEALDQLDNLETRRRHFRRHHTLVTFTTQVTSVASRRIKHQRTINTALRANLRHRDKRIQELINEKHSTSLVLEKLRRIAKLKIDMIYKNIMSLPSKLARSSSGPMVQETIETYLEEVDSSASIEEARRIISRLKEFGRFLRSEESFEDFLKNQETRHKESNTATLVTSEQTLKRRELLENNAPRRILRRQKVNRSLLETRQRAARRMINRSEPEVERRDCRNLPKSGKHCRCCCYEAKMKKLAASREDLPLVDTMPTVSAERDVFPEPESRHEEVAIQRNEMNETTCQMQPGVADAYSEVESKVEQGLVTNNLETSGKICLGNHQETLEIPSSDRDKEANDRDDPINGTSTVDLTAVVKDQSEHGPSNVQESAVGLTGNCLQMTRELSAEDIEKQKDIMKKVSDLLVDKWFLEGQVKALEDNERELTVAKSEISCQLDAAHRQLARSSSDTGRLLPSHNILALEEKLGHLHSQLEEMKEKQDADEMVKSRLQSELDDCKKKVVDLESVKKRLEGEVEGWMETVMEVRKGRINLLNHMDNITEKVGKLSLNKSSCNDNTDDLSTVHHDGRRRSLMKETCGCSNHDMMTVNELKADIETLAEQRKIQDSQIEQLSDLLQKANDQKQQLMNNLVDVQQERRSLQFDFDQLLARV